MGFTFGKNTVDIVICGATYSIDPYGENVLEAMVAYRDGLSQEETKNAGEAQRVEGVYKLVEQLVTKLFGEGAYTAIFAERKPALLDHMELVSYIISTIEAFRVQRIMQFTKNDIANAQAIMEQEGAQ